MSTYLKHVVSILYYELGWTYRRISEVCGTGPEAVRRYLGPIDRKKRMAVVRAARAAKASAATTAERPEP